MTSLTIAQYRKLPKRSKYGNRKVEYDGIMFDSMREAARWRELKLLERARKISCLSRQYVCELAPSVRIVGEKRARPALRYIADFVYLEGDKWVVEDVKSAFTAKNPLSRAKIHLMKAVRGIDVRIV